VIIPARFAGPPDSANGGVIAATLLGERAGEVTIRRPVPVEVELAREDGRLLTAGGELLAESRALADDEAAALRREADVTPAVALDHARAAGERSPLAEGHPFPTCFGCGPDAPDGIHCLAGPVDHDDLWAVAFTPPEATPPYVWAALDCPSSAPHLGAMRGVPHVLGRIAGLPLAPLTAGAEHVVVARATGGEGRKRHSVSVIQDAEGRPLAVARATWIALPSQP
jgi:hypothetical protein